MMEFKDRKKELNEIREMLDSDKFEFLVLYGRRRVGKTELILNSTKNKKRIYYLAVGEKNLERFYESCKEYDSNVSNLKMDFEILINYLKDKCEVIIIDEIQNMIKEDKNILNLFQSLVDTKLKNSKLKLIFLGSSVSIITSKVLSYKEPLYGRRTGSINLKPVSFFDLQEFFPKLSFEEILEIYGFADGIPYYLIKIDSDLWDWIKKELKTERSFLRDEVDFLMRYEFDDASTYKLIIEAIAYGKNRLNEIKDFIKVKRTDLGPYLKNLIDVDMIKREIPITENIKSRNGRYFLKDNFLKFWFRFIYPNLSSIESEIFNIELIKKEYTSYLGYIFEDVSKNFLTESKLFKFNKIGRWWYKDNEIDIVALNEDDNEVVFCECKWQDNINAESLFKELKEKSVHVKWKNENRTEKYIIFARSFSKKIKNFNNNEVHCFDITDFKKLMNKNKKHS